MTRGRSETPRVESNQDQNCINCKTNLDTMKMCTGCNSVYYCSLTCQKKHRGQHKVICQAVQCLRNKVKKDSQTVSINGLKGVVHELSPKGRKQIAKVVGERCIVSVLMDKETHAVLWDTGAQVCLAGKEWLKSNFPGKQLRPVSELFDMGLSVKSASGDELYLKGGLS